MYRSIRNALLIMVVLLSFEPLRGANNPCADAANLVTVTGPEAVLLDDTVSYTCQVATVSYPLSFTWTHEGFNSPSVSTVNGLSILTVKAKDLSLAIGDKEIKCVCNRTGIGSCSDTIDATILKIEILPDIMRLEDGEDSVEEYVCTVTPNNLSPSFQWLSGTENMAWLEPNCYDPKIEYTEPNKAKTKIENAHWFANMSQPDAQNIMKCGVKSYYGIGVEVEFGGIKIKLKHGAGLVVDVDMTGDSGLTLVNHETIECDDDDEGVFRVTGRGDFDRDISGPSANCHDDSDFKAKILEHENTHITQFETGMLSGMCNPNLVYAICLGLRADTEAELRRLIRDEVDDEIDKYKAAVANFDVPFGLGYASEKEAITAQNAVAPDHLEWVNEDDWIREYE